MGIISTKKNLLKISLILIMVLSIILCIYTLSNYKSTTGVNPTHQNEIINFDFNRNTQHTNRNMQKKPQKNINSKNINARKNFGNKNRSSRYAPLLSIYLVLFIGLCILILYFTKYKNVKIADSNKKLVIFSILFLGLFLKISLSTVMEGHSGDLSLFKNWASTAANSFSNFYSNARSSDYPPLYIYILSIIGKLGSISSMSSYYTILLKLPSIIADVITGYLIYRIAKKHFSFESSMILSLFYIFNPAVFIDSTLWGQVDSFFTLIVMLAVFFISENKIILSSILFTCAVLMKPQGIIFLPVLFFELVKNKSVKLFIKSIISSLVTFLVIILPFSFNQDALWIFKLYSNTISEYPYASVNGFNFFYLLGGNYKESSTSFLLLNYSSWGLIAIVAITLFSWFMYAKSKNKNFAFCAALIQIAGVFTFSTGMHERYLFPALAFCILSSIYIKDKRFMILCLGYTLTIYINIYSILFRSIGTMNYVTSLLNIILFIYLIKIFVDKIKKTDVSINEI
jgi:Gpi18-like mannosyltransferase